MSIYENYAKDALKKVILELHENRVEKQAIEKYIDKSLVDDVFNEIKIRENIDREKQQLDDRLVFILKPEHIKLMQRFNVEFSREFYLGSPMIDMKRPYGNSDIEDDIRQITGKNLTDSQCADLHAETKFALQILVMHGEIKTGTYKRTASYKDDWNLTDKINDQPKEKKI